MRGLAATAVYKRSQRIHTCLHDSPALLRVHSSRAPAAPVWVKARVFPTVSFVSSWPMSGRAAQRRRVSATGLTPPAGPCVRPGQRLPHRPMETMEALRVLTRPLTNTAPRWVAFTEPPRRNPSPIPTETIDVRSHSLIDGCLIMPSYPEALQRSAAGGSITGRSRSRDGTLRLPACSGPQLSSTSGPANGFPCNMSVSAESTTTERENIDRHRQLTGL